VRFYRQTLTFVLLILIAISLDLFSARVLTAGSHLDFLDFPFVFFKPGGVLPPELKYLSHVYCLWTADEQLVIRSRIDEIKSKSPCILSNVAFDKPLLLCRVDDELLASSRKPFIAFSAPYVLGFSKRFFQKETSNQALALVHELVHQSDQGGRVAYSSEWAKPRTLTLGRRLLVDRLMLPKSQWESELGSQEYFSLKELLAREVVSNFERNKLETFCTTYGVFSSDRKNLEYEQHYRLGRIAIGIGDYTEGVRQFDAANKIVPNAPLASAYLAYCLLHKENENPKALAHARSSYASFRQLGCSADDQYYRFLLRTLVEILIASDKFNEAKGPLEEIILNEPNNREVLLQHAECAEKTKNYNEAIDDIYLATCSNDRRVGFTFSQLEDFVFVERILTKCIDSTTTSFGLEEVRASFYYALATQDNDNQKTWVATAFENMRHLLERRKVPNDHLVIQAANLSMLSNNHDYLTELLDRSRNNLPLHSLLEFKRYLMSDPDAERTELQYQQVKALVIDRE